MITDEMIDAYFSQYHRDVHLVDAGDISPRESVRRRLEAVLAAEAWKLKDAVNHALDVYRDEPMAVDALNYLKSLLNLAAVEGEK